MTDDALGTNVLSLDGTDAALFEMEGLVLYLKAGTVLDYETNPTLAVIVAVEDATVGGTPDDTADLSLPIADVNETLCVERTQAIPSGFVVHFNRPIEGSVLNLYDTQAGVYGPSDFTVTGAAVGPIAGSLVLEDAATAVTFVQTGGPLAADTYTLVLRSAANAFQDTAGHLLDGDADEVDGGDYVTAVVVPATTARRISVPDFTRGPGQEVDVPATDSGIPLTISEGSGILSVDFTVEYDPSLLTVTGVSGAADLPSDWSLACNLGTPGRVPVSVYGPTPLGSGPVRLAGIEAHVPSEAPCGSAAVLGLDGVQINGGTVSGVADGGIQAVAYFGDVTGNYGYSGLDAVYVARVAVGLDSGFAAYRVKDPVLLGDVTGDGKVSGLDAGLIARKAVGFSVPQIPDLPGVLPPMVNTGPDPLLTIPDDLSAHPGETVSVPVSLLANADGDIAGFLGGNICLSYDPAVFDVTAADVHLGSLFPAAEGWARTVLVAGGRINVVIFRTEYHTGGEGTALVIDFHVRSDAPLGTTVLHPTEDSALNEGALVLTLDDGLVTILTANQPPTVALAHPVPTLAENTDTTSRVKVADIEVTDDGEGTNALTLEGADAALFEIDPAELTGTGTASLYLKAGAVLDFATNPTLDATVAVHDATLGVEATVPLSISITDVNEAPTVALANTTTSLPENTSTASHVKVADIVVTDDALGVNTVSLSGADAALFEIAGAAFYLKAGTILDYETQSALHVTVGVDDPAVGATPDGTAALSLSITDGNEPPTVALTHTVTTLAENPSTSSPTKAADIVVSDDALGTHVLSVGGADAGLFEIVGTELYLKAGTVLDHAANPVLDVTVAVDDTTMGSGVEDTATLSIDITEVNEAPTVALANTVTSLPGSTHISRRMKVADIVVTDDGVGTNVLSLSGAQAALFEIRGLVLYLKGGTTLHYETTPVLEVIVAVNDASVGNTPDDTATLLIRITDVNDAPAVALANTVTSLAEDTDTTGRVKVADIVVMDDALGTNALSLSGVNAAWFEIDPAAVVGAGSATLYLKGGTTLDYETTSVLEVVVAVNDAGVGTTPDGTAALAITVTDGNEAPTVALTNTVTSLAESTDTTGRVKVADIVVTDDGLGVNELSLGGANAALFEIEGLALYLKAGTTLDCETTPVLEVVVAVDDADVGTTPDGTATLVISITDVNQPPTVALANTVTSLAENADTTSRIKVADIVVTDDALGVNTLSLSGTDAALFEIEGLGLYLKAGTMLDYETTPVLEVTVAVDDAAVGATPDGTAALTISVTDVNEPPTVALANTVTSLAENTDTTSRIKVADILVTDDGLGTNELSLGGAEAALFEIDGLALYLKAGTTLSYETTPALEVTVAVDDAGVGTTPDSTAALSITVTDVNETPAVALANTVTSLAENTDTTSRIKVADIVVTDDALGVNTLSLSGTDAALFEIEGLGLYLKAGTTLDCETTPVLEVVVAVDDADVGTTPDGTATLAISITDVNQPPTVALANTVTSLAENADTTSRIKVADILVTDDGLGTNELSLSGTEADLFEIEGLALYLKAGTTLDFETTPVLEVTVAVDDAAVGATPDSTAALSISITDVNQPPTVALANTVTSLAENADTTSRIKVADILVTDDGLGTNELSLGGAQAALFEIDGLALYLKAGTALDYETTPALEVTVAVDDADVGTTPDGTAALSISITDVNQPPTVALANTVTSLVENADTTSRIKVADIVVTDDALGVNTLILSGAQADLFEMEGLALYLKAGTTLDCETTPVLEVVVAVDDASVGGTSDGTAPLSITVMDGNEAPTVALANTVTSLAENTDTTSRVKVADIVVTDDALGLNHLSLSGTHAALFEMEGLALYLKAGTTLDCETTPVLEVVVAVDDASVGGIPDGTAPLSITVMDGNEAPAVALANMITSLAENTDTTSRIRVADIVVTDDALGVNELSLTGTQAALFEMEGLVLYLKAGTTLDYETTPVLDVTVAVDDAGVGAPPDDTAALAITVTDVNEAPTVALANVVTGLAENTDTTSRVKVADILVTDDALGLNELSLSGTHAALFEIDPTVIAGSGTAGLYLKAGTTLDFETTPALEVIVVVDNADVGLRTGRYGRAGDPDHGRKRGTGGS